MDDIELEKAVDAAGGDIGSVYQDLQQQFSDAYAKSQALFAEEQQLRQVLAFHKRRNNALLDLMDGESEATGLERSDVDELLARVENVVAMNPDLADLNHIRQVVDGKASANLKLLMLLDESLPELEADDPTKVQKNPQDAEMWLRRNYSELVLSKFRPLEFKDNGLVKADGIADAKRRRK